jgi:hypothetical protein
MRRRLGALLLTGLLCGLAGCGGDDDETPTASDPAPASDRPAASTTGTPSDPPTTTGPPTTTDPGDPSGPPTKSPPLTPGGVPFELVELVSRTAGRGVVSDRAVPITSASELDAFVADLSAQLAGDVSEAYAANPVQAGQTLYAAVVGLGCDVPPGVEVSRAGAGYEISGRKVAEPLPNCFAPVTSVALVAIGS